MQHLQIEKSLDSKTEFWGICCESGKRYSQIVGKKFHISMAALDPTDTSTSAVVSLMAEHDGSQYLLCSLKKDSILQVILNLFFDKGENITFFLKGHGTVHLSGYYVSDTADDVETSKDNKKAPLNKLENKGGKANFTVSANVESSEEDTSDESDEATVKVSPAKSAPVTAKNMKAVLNNKSQLPKAVANEEQSSEDDLTGEESDDSDMPNPVSEKSISPVKKSSPGKKLLEENSKEAEESSDEDLFEDEDSEDEEDDSEDEKNAKQPGAKRGHSAVESDVEEDDSSDDDDSSDSEALKEGINKIKKQLQQKKLKAEESTPVQNKGGKKSGVGNFSGDGRPDMNSSIGRTPMPKKMKLVVNEMKQQGKSPKTDSKTDESNTSATKTPEKSGTDLNTSAQSESAKKKKNKKKAKQASENQVSNMNTPSKSPVKQQFSHKLAGGIEYEDIRPGSGLVAKKGKLVHVYYTGQLENNKVFDSCKQGQKPFSFKLASGQVIKGWDLGIEGMKVGGKRRLKIPPNMGYANKRTGPIPPNSTLYFTVELKSIS